MKQRNETSLEGENSTQAPQDRSSRPIGRPAGSCKPEALAMRSNLNIRVKAAALVDIASAAKRAGLSQSEWIRRELAAAAKRQR